MPVTLETSQVRNSPTAKEDEMRHRSLFVVGVWVVSLFVTLFASQASVKVAAQERTTSSKQQQQVQPAQTTVKQVKPVKPVSPFGAVGADLRIDARAGDIAAAGATEVMVFDLQGDGLDLGGRAKIRVGGSERDTNWTRRGTADAFLVVDAARLQDMGFEIAGADGLPIQNRILVSDGLNIRTPDGQDHVMTDSWSPLGRFDSNHDGKLNASDGAWQSMSLFVDANADGTMSEGELDSLGNSVVREISLVKSQARTDAHGNTLTDGVFVRTNGTTGALAGVNLRRY
jgi:hypothetical protein